MTTRYHRDIGFPQYVVGPEPGLPLTYSRHAQQEASKDLWDLLPQTLPDHTLIEAEVLGRRETKWVVRVPTGTQHDLVLVVLPTGFVKTVWLNHTTDTHRTLRRELYQEPK
jgi:hypothetical protein